MPALTDTTPVRVLTKNGRDMKGFWGDLEKSLIDIFQYDITPLIVARHQLIDTGEATLKTPVGGRYQISIIKNDTPAGQGEGADSRISS